MGRWRKIHASLSLIFALPFILAALSGAMLGFARESDRIMHVELMAAPFSSAAPLSAGQLLDQARQAYPSWQPLGLGLPLTPVDAALVLMEDDHGQRQEVYLHPRTGEVRGVRPMSEGFYGLALRLHTTLLLDEPGRWIMGFAALGLILTTLSGLLLRQRHAKGSVTARTHPLLGLTTAPLLVLIGASGLSLIFYSPSVGSSAYLAQQTTSMRTTLEDPSPALLALHQFAPSCSPRWLEALADGGLRIACEIPQHAGTLGLRWFLWTQTDGLQAQDDLPRSGDLLYNLHTGELFGMPGRILWVLASLSIPLLWLGGLASRKARIQQKS